MATYKIISKKTGKSRSGLTLEQGLALTKMTQPQFLAAYENGHPTLTIIREDGGRPRDEEGVAGTTGSQGEKKKPSAAVQLIGLFIGMGIVFALLSSREEPVANASECWGNDKSDSIFYAEEAVKKRLRSPSTAKFPWQAPDIAPIDGQKCSWRVTGYVDSQNGFGAMVRSHYSVDVKIIDAQSATTTAVEIW